MRINLRAGARRWRLEQPRRGRGGLRRGAVDWARDYGRGEAHLSADCDEGDVVAYLTGQWEVDGVLVGDEEADPKVELMVLDHLQVVWTHNCEHGQCRGWALAVSPGGGVEVTGREDLVQCGPEQLVARLGCRWKDEDTGQLVDDLPEEIGRLVQTQ
ncbi:hypothetical protein HOP50_13g69490 [Chloropicon primus]|uniref:Uncharacterized protein n=2 Tax=Chloropicon primus TaxID=1764295 RepID=A0A5B8MVN3_9CHLO|nr:hypothetical protein A3770_13p69290 [Chloropicon primus]UPR03619.1 hypothetical protein HOP50_13g69490 [Chloropicon primus]|eukprot:QDZ24411.1 hypothetical protein A3770_13p69290 [Chloropicon primus]